MTDRQASMLVAGIALSIAGLVLAPTAFGFLMLGAGFALGQASLMAYAASEQRKHDRDKE